MRKYWFFILITIGIFILGALPSNRQPLAYHSPQDLMFFLQHRDPVDSSFIFPTSSHCNGCHGFDVEEHALIDADSNDVNIFDDWSASVMAQSAKDPFWRAKVKHESLTFPHLATEIQSTCTKCHAPMGYYSAILRGAETYVMDDLKQDTVGLDGVSCGACHQVSPVKPGTTFSGQIRYDTNRTLFGPYPLPFEGPMRDFVGFTPKFSDHIFKSEICASCHTLVTHTIDQNGQPTDHPFAEQATYHEWVNSAFPLLDKSCQSCHMPYLEDSIHVAAGYAMLDKRFPYALHHLAGANTMMLKIMQSFGDSLDISVSEKSFAENLEVTRNFLKTSVSLKMEMTEAIQDSIEVEVMIENRIGHKFPSGYPSRRAWLELIATSEEGVTIFHSGKMEANRIVDADEPYEPHYNHITQENQVQIYQMIVGDELGQEVTVLTRGYEPLKDNRLPPRGFSKSHPNYDTTAIFGFADVDPDFNFDESGEGSGSDKVIYTIPVSDPVGLYFVQVNLWYQSIPPEWTDDLFELNAAEIDRFKWMYDSIGAIPELVASFNLDSLQVGTTGINKNGGNDARRFVLYPIPNMDGMLYIRKTDETTFSNMNFILLNADGREINRSSSSNLSHKILLPNQSGVYILQIWDQNHLITTEKIIRIK